MTAHGTLVQATRFGFLASVVRRVERWRRVLFGCQAAIDFDSVRGVDTNGEFLGLVGGIAGLDGGIAAAL